MDKSAPSKESLERAQKWVARKGFQWPESAMEWLALEFDAIARERDEVTEKLVEALGKMLERHLGQEVWGAQAMTDKPTDLQAALRKACDEAAGDIARDARYSEDMTCPSRSAMKNRMLQHFRPVFEALRDSVIEECAKVAGQCWNNWNSEQFCHAAHIERQIRALKGAPR